MEAQLAENPGHSQWFCENHKSLYPLHPFQQGAKGRLNQKRHIQNNKRDGLSDHPFCCFYFLTKILCQPNQ
jgi:hypothetical protein